MTTVRVYSPSVGEAASPSQRQQTFDQGQGEIGRGLQALGHGLGSFARAKDDFNARVDQATAADLDASFSNAVRGIERDFAASQGRNTVDMASDTQKAWNETAASYLAQAKNPRQSQMMSAALDQRRQRWSSQYDGHLQREGRAWQDTSYQNRLSSMAVDATDLPVGSTERADAYMAIGGALDEYVAWKGGDAEMRRTLGQATFSEIHVNTVGALIDADPVAAKRYFDEHSDQILPAARNALGNKVREAELDFTAYSAVRESFIVDADPDVEVDVEGDRQTLRISQPVSARVGSRFGPRRSQGGGSTNHKGVDFPVPVNTPVEATLPGVVRVKSDPDGYGDYVVIEHGNGLETRYAHLGSVNVRDGQRVEQGEVVALSGGARGARGAGNSQGPHLHYEVRRNGQAVDPESLNDGVEVSPGGGRSETPGRPTTEDDVLDWAEAETRRRGGDWRMQRALERAGLAEINRKRSARADGEAEAMREAEPYLPGGAQAVSDAASIPRAIWNRMSPGQQRAATNAIKTEAEGDAKVDPRQSDDLEHSFRDLAAGDAARRQQFMDMDLTVYRPLMTRTAYNGLVDLQRNLRGDRPTGMKSAATALEGASGMVNQYARAAGIETGDKATGEDRQRLALMSRYVQDRLLQAQETKGAPLTEAERRGVIALAARQVEIEVDHDDNPRTTPQRQRVRAFETTRGQASFLVIPAAARQDIERRFRAGLAGRGLPARAPTSAEVQTIYNRGVQEGIYDVPDTPREN